MKGRLTGAAKGFLALPVYALYCLYRLRLFRFVTASCGLALVPGAVGSWWRRCWYQCTLPRCGQNLYMNWMAVIFYPATRIGDNVTIGPSSSIFDADIGDNVMIGTNVAVPRGVRQHEFARLDIPMNRQPGQPRKIKIGDDVWIGTGAVILADIAPGSIVGAGAVVTQTFESHSILAGVPARVIRRRGQAPEQPQAGTSV